MASTPSPIPMAILLMITLCLAPLFSVEAPSDPPPPPEARSWKLSINGGLTLNSGNTRNRMFNGNAAFAIKLDGFELDTELDFLYGKNSWEVIQNKGKWTSHFSRSLNQSLNLFGQVVMEYDRIAEIDLRTTAGLGLRIDLLDTERLKTELTASINGEFLNSPGDAAILRSLRLRISLRSKILFSETAGIDASLLYTPDVTKMARDYRLEGDISLSLLMKKPVWLTIRLKDRYNNAPLSARLEKNDLTLINSIEIRF